LNFSFLPKLNPGPFKKEKDEILFSIAKKGKLAKQFFESRFWLDYLEPHWKDCVLKGCSSSFLHEEDRRSIEQVALTSAFNSGRFAELNSQMRDIQKWISDGDQAQKEIEIREELEKTKKEVGIEV